jgi:hypothetical protein
MTVVIQPNVVTPDGKAGVQTRGTVRAADDATVWAQLRLVAKNELSAADAQQVEEAFAAKLAVMPTIGIAFRGT